MHTDINTAKYIPAGVFFHLFERLTRPEGNVVNR